MRYSAKNIVKIAAYLLLASSLQLSSARAENFACNTIPSLPYVIKKPGTYCLDKDHNLKLDYGSAIEVLVGNVTIDFNSHMINNLAAGPKSTARGINAGAPFNVSIRNGKLRGFNYGIMFSSSSQAKGLIIENMDIEYSGQGALYLRVRDSVVRNNRITDSGFYHEGYALASGIRLVVSHNVVVENNLVSNVAKDESGTWGYAIMVRQKCSSIMLLNNQVAEANYGIYAETGATGLVRDNFISGTTNNTYVMPNMVDLGNNF